MKKRPFTTDEYDIPYTVAFDFDGTVVTKAYPKIGKPNFLVIKLLQKLREADWSLVLWTCRHDARTHLDEALSVCSEWHIKPDYVNENPNVWPEFKEGRKIFAHLYLDDQSMLPLEDMILRMTNTTSCRYVSQMLVTTLKNRQLEIEENLQNDFIKDQ